VQPPQFSDLCAGSMGEGAVVVLKGMPQIIVLLMKKIMRNKF
jgi:hypothetical protein